MFGILTQRLCSQSLSAAARWRLFTTELSICERREIVMLSRLCICCFQAFSYYNRYGLTLTWTELVMAEGNCFGEMPSFDSSSEAKKRHFSSDGSESVFGLSK